MTTPQHSSQQFVVDQLKLENRQGGGIYQLSEASVSPTRAVGVDEDGNIIEETICTLAKSAKFVDLGGNICDVPLRTGRVLSFEPEAVRYEQIVETDIIRGGQLPLGACPYTHAYRHIKGGPLVKVPEGEKDCGGKPEGCEHVWKVITSRRAAAKAKIEREEVNYRQMKEGDVKTMMAGFGQVFGEAIANAQQTGRANLRAGKGEKDEK